MNEIQKRLAHLDKENYPFSETVAKDAHDSGIEDRMLVFLKENLSFTRSSVLLWLTEQPEFIEICD